MISNIILSGLTGFINLREVEATEPRIRVGVHSAINLVISAHLPKDEVRAVVCPV
jgi:phosphotransferase system IIB component